MTFHPMKIIYFLFAVLGVNAEHVIQRSNDHVQQETTNDEEIQHQIISDETMQFFERLLLDDSGSMVVPTKAPPTYYPVVVPVPIPVGRPPVIFPVANPVGIPSPTFSPVVVPVPIPMGLPPAIIPVANPVGIPSPNISQALCVDCRLGGIFGDPHIITFDNLRYDCMGQGDYILFRAMESGVEIQTRFRLLSSGLVSVITGIVISGGIGFPTIQINIENGSNEQFLYVNGVETDPSTGYEDAMVSVTLVGNEFLIILKGLNLYVRVAFTGTFYNIQVEVPMSLWNQDIRGLLGSPDENPTNDWTNKNGTLLVLPPDWFSDETMYNYFVQNWCIANMQESLFVYNDNFSFEENFGCNRAYPGSVDVTRASQELQNLCGTDSACLIDGIELGLEVAQLTLETIALLSMTSASNRFRVQPSAITTNQPLNNLLTVNVSGLSTIDVTTIDAFNVYRFDSNALTRGTIFVVRLLDDGIGADNQLADLIYSGVLAIISNTTGETFGFQVVPVINGVESTNTADLTYISINAVQSYSLISGIGVQPNVTSNSSLIQLNTIEDQILVIRYSWPADQPDLDTGTTFLGTTLGFGCNNDIEFTQYMSFTGDDQDFGGEEIVTIQLGASNMDGSWVGTTQVIMNAGWFTGGFDVGQGPASLTIYTETNMNGVVVNGNNAISFVISPGQQLGCSSFVVATANISILDTGAVTIAIEL